MLYPAVSIRQGQFHLTFPGMVIPAISRHVKPLWPKRALKNQKSRDCDNVLQAFPDLSSI
jgi:hypothetical protein